MVWIARPSCALLSVHRGHFLSRPAAQQLLFFIIIPSVERDNSSSYTLENSIRLCCPSQLCMYILRSFSSWENGKAERKRGGRRRRRRWKKSIHMYIYALPLDYIYKVYTYSSTYRNKVEHSCSSIGEKERRRKIGGEMSI